MLSNIIKYFVELYWEAGILNLSSYSSKKIQVGLSGTV